MKKNLFAFALFVSAQFISAQTTTNYWILLKDKKNNPYSIQHPEAFLTERSILRREKQHITIKEKDLPVNPSYVTAIKAAGVQIKGRSKWSNAVLVVGTEASINKIKQLNFVKSIRQMDVSPIKKLNSKFEMETTSAPVSTPPIKAVTSLNYGLAYNQVHMIGMDCMHDLGFQGQGMVIAQLDAGFFHADSLPAFDTLRTHGRILGTWDFVTGDSSVYEDFPHGMNVLSCMGGNLPGRIVGTAPQASFWLLRTEDAYHEGLIEEVNWLMGAEFADSVGADVINSSLGYSLFDNPADNHTYADMDGNTTIITNAADWAASVGIFVTSSAGNSAGPPWFKITAPADADSILTVGAVDSALTVASFSSRGPTYDGRIKPNTAAKGVGACIAANGGDVTYANGTSFSSPITAGAVACLWQAHPSKNIMEILLAIEQSASQYATPDTLIGYGIPNFCTANTLLTGIEENSDNNDLMNVYPNPFTNAFEISFYSNKKQEVEILLFDVEGRKMNSTRTFMQSGFNKVSFSENTELSTGIYFMEMKTNERSYFRKLVKE